MEELIKDIKKYNKKIMDKKIIDKIFKKYRDHDEIEITKNELLSLIDSIRDKYECNICYDKTSDIFTENITMFEKFKTKTCKCKIILCQSCVKKISCCPFCRHTLIDNEKKQDHEEWISKMNF